MQGAERSLLDLVIHLDRKRFEPLVILPWRGPMEETLRQTHISYVIRFTPCWISSPNRISWSYPFTWLSGLRARLWSLLALIEREKIDLVYTNTSTLLEGALAARRARLPHVWHIHEHLCGNADLHCPIPPFWIDKLTLALSARIITPSHALAKARFPNAAKVRVVPNGIDLNAFNSGDGQRLRQELGISSKAPVITCIGAISRTKDPLTFIRAAAVVQRRFPNAHFLLAGTVADPELERQARALAQTESLKVHFLGYRHDVADLLAAATVHVSTSNQESFGRTLVEAMASG
ncbi:MAG: glycosyltransferase, partial [Methylohalobius sp.]